MKLIRGRLVPKIKSLAAAGIEPATIARLCRCAPKTSPRSCLPHRHRRQTRPDRYGVSWPARSAGCTPTAGPPPGSPPSWPWTRPPSPSCSAASTRPDPRGPAGTALDPGPPRSGGRSAATTTWPTTWPRPPAPIAIDPGPDMAAQSHGPAADAAVATEALDWGPLQGRWARGGKCGASKLSDDDARRAGSCGPTA